MLYTELKLYCFPPTTSVTQKDTDSNARSQLIRPKYSPDLAMPCNLSCAARGPTADRPVLLPPVCTETRMVPPSRNEAYSSDLSISPANEPRISSCNVNRRYRCRIRNAVVLPQLITPCSYHPRFGRFIGRCQLCERKSTMYFSISSPRKAIKLVHTNSRQQFIYFIHSTSYTQPSHNPTNETIPQPKHFIIFSHEIIFDQ